MGAADSGVPDCGGSSVVALDLYPDPPPHRPMITEDGNPKDAATQQQQLLKAVRHAACALDLARSAGAMVMFSEDFGAQDAAESAASIGSQGRPFLLIEQPVSAVNWRAINLPRPTSDRTGCLRSMSYQVGCYFCWSQNCAS
eukprot:SAG31_NODE_5123_length_2727_cov_1.896119_2_plen_142_part_00